MKQCKEINHFEYRWNLLVNEMARTGAKIKERRKEKKRRYTLRHTATEGLLRIQYKCLVPIYVFPEIKLCSLVIPKQNYNVLSPSSYTHIPVRDLRISREGFVYFAVAKYVHMWTDPGNI